MAARRYETEKSPEEQARDQIRFNDTLQNEQKRRDLISARILHRNQALKAGVPKSFLPDPSQIKNMDDATWNEHASRMSRMGFHGVDDQGRLLPAPNQSPLVQPRATLPASVRSKTPLEGISEGTRGVSKAAGFETPAPSIAAPADVTPAAPLNEFSTTPGDARAIAARYGTGDAKTTFSKAPDRIPFIAGADGVDVGPAIAARVSQNDPTLSPTLKKPPTNVPVPPALNQLMTVPTLPSDPSFNVNKRPAQFNTDLTKPGPVFPVEPTVPSNAEAAGQSVRRVLQAIPKETTFGSSAVHADKLPPEKPIFSIPDFWRGLTQSPATATNSSAAQFEKPTKENPTPVTPTSPTANIDRTDNSLANFGLSEDDITKRKLAFAGF